MREQVKEMDHYKENVASIGCAISGGLGKLLLFATPDPVFNFLSAVVTALFCALAGMLGRDLYKYLKPKFQKFFKTK